MLLIKQFKSKKKKKKELKEDIKLRNRTNYLGSETEYSSEWVIRWLLIKSRVNPLNKININLTEPDLSPIIIDFPLHCDLKSLKSVLETTKKFGFLPEFVLFEENEHKKSSN